MGTRCTDKSITYPEEPMAEDVKFQQKMSEAQQLATGLRATLEAALNIGLGGQSDERIAALQEARRDVEWVESQINRLAEEA